MAGVANAEILSRFGLKVLILEQNKKLSMETTNVYHEWFHTGTLYTILADKLRTTRYCLGAVDDLLEFYSGFQRMNLLPGSKGFSVKGPGWFDQNQVEYRYQKSFLHPWWAFSVARARWLVEEIKGHDWLRRKAGSSHDGFRLNPFMIFKHFSSGKKCESVTSPDMGIRTQEILGDLVRSFLLQGGKIQLDNKVISVKEKKSSCDVLCHNGKIFSSDKILYCCAQGVSRLRPEIPIKISYAPMHVCHGLGSNAKSFVELHPNPSKCINLIVKERGFGLAGGISFEKQEQARTYAEFLWKEHSRRNPKLKLLDSYIGLKQEALIPGQPRNYLYHILPVSPRQWAVILGKFTLMFSMAPEFARLALGKNPPRSTTESKIPLDRPNQHSSLIAKPRWRAAAEKYLGAPWE